MKVGTPDSPRATSHVGQISVSVKKNASSRTSCSTRATTAGASSGSRRATCASRMLCASASPVRVSVETMHERPGKRVRSCATSGRTAFSSPTDAAWIQKAGAPVPMARSSGVTSPSRSRSPRHDAGAPGTRAAARASRAATLIVPR